MDKELKKKWVDALRSGDYEQSRHYLYDGTGYCALGVLASCLGVPDHVLQKQGFLRHIPLSRLIGEDREETTFVTMNGNGASFAEIANFIENEWEG